MNHLRRAVKAEDSVLLNRHRTIEDGNQTQYDSDLGFVFENPWVTDIPDYDF